MKNEDRFRTLLMNRDFIVRRLDDPTVHVTNDEINEMYDLEEELVRMYMEDNK